MLRAILVVGLVVTNVICAPPAAAQSGEFLRRSQAGEVECWSPDRAARTCRAMSTYRSLEGGRIVNDAIVFLQHDPRVIMFVSSDVHVRDEMICGTVLSSDLDAAYFEIDGVRADDEQAHAIRGAVAQLFAGISEVCSRHTRDGEQFLVTAIVDGIERADLSDRMVWIRPEDGYTIDPAETSAT
jgi:hypothetical protein